MSSLHHRRIEQEWQLLQLLSKENSELLRDCTRSADIDHQLFRFQLRKSQALVGDSGVLQIQDTHWVTVSFPRFFPAVPLEVSVARPVFHPNVHSETGFVCLWNRFSMADTVLEAVAQLQRVISWSLFNEEPDHLMQPQSLEWYRDPGRSISLPLLFEPPKRPKGIDLPPTYTRPEGSSRRRLE